MAKGSNNAKVTRIDKTNDSRDRSPLEPMNKRQQEYINAIYSSSVVLCTGVVGSSKTYIPTVIFSDMLLDKRTEQIIIARPAEGFSKSTGFLPGTANEKLASWCAPVLNTLIKRLGEGNVQMFLENGKIQMLELDKIKGQTWDDACIIIDEGEDLSIPTVKSLLQRQGIRSKLVICGDEMQKDIKQNSGLDYVLDIVENQNLNIPHIDFDSFDYCVRSEEAKMWAMAFYDKDHPAK